MNCHQVRNNLIFYYYGELEDYQMQQIKEHLQQCDLCRREYNKLALALDYAHKQSQMKAPSDIWQAISGRIDNTQPTKTRTVWLSAVQLIAAAAAIAIAILIGSLMGRTYVEQSYQIVSHQQLYEDYDSLVEAFTSFDQSVYIVLDK